MIDSMKKAIASQPDFVEVRGSTGSMTRVRLREKDIETASSGSSSGFSARTLHKGAWGFAYTSDETKLPEIVKEAARLAKAASRKSLDASLAGKSTAEASITLKPKRHPADLGLDEKVSLCKELLAQKPEGIVTHDLDYADAWGKSYYVNSEGAAIEYVPVRSFLAFSAYSKKNGELLSAHDAVAGLKGVELLDNQAPLITSVFEKALLMQEAQLPPKGKMPVIIDPKMAGVFAHEMVGHAGEGDTVANGKSILLGKLGRLLGSSHVNIVDDPTLPELFGSYPYDAEGTKTRRTQLFKAGRIMEFLQSRESAARLNAEPTGNSRAESTANFPIVRMSNTFFEAGDHTDEELFDGANGVYAIGTKGGVTEPNTGYFQFAAEYGWLVENGEKTKPLRDVTLVGNLLETLRNVDACGKTIKLGSPGFCGKAGQSVAVSDGGPHIKIKEVLVG
ncbi:TldD/PmbA family protein [archaeon]